MAENNQLGSGGAVESWQPPQDQVEGQLLKMKKMSMGELVDGTTLHAGINKDKIVRQEETRKLEDNV